MSTSERCPFCEADPYEYVDIGVGVQPVAVTCCAPGYLLLQEGDKIAQEASRLLTSNNEVDLERAKALIQQMEGGDIPSS